MIGRDVFKQCLATTTTTSTTVPVPFQSCFLTPAQEQLAHYRELAAAQQQPRMIRDDGAAEPTGEQEMADRLPASPSPASPPEDVLPVSVNNCYANAAAASGGVSASHEHSLSMVGLLFSVCLLKSAK